MTFLQLVAAVLVLALSALAQQTSKTVTVPITLDHNRIVIDVYLPLSDGTNKRVRAWVDYRQFRTDDESTDRGAVRTRKLRGPSLQRNPSA